MFNRGCSSYTATAFHNCFLNDATTTPPFKKFDLLYETLANGAMLRIHLQALTASEQ